MSVDMIKKKFEILIIGGGIAGPALALALKKIGYTSTIFEAQQEITKSKGSWLALMPNGLNALKNLNIGSMTNIATPSRGLNFFNYRGKNLGRFDHESFQDKFHSQSLVMKRSHLHQFLHNEIQKQDISILFNKRLKHIEQKQNSRVVAHFEDNSSYEGDILIGCDGIHSKVREFILKETPRPSYTGVVGFGGFSSLALTDKNTGSDLTMTFGKEAFFGYFPANANETFWYSNIPQKNEPSRDEQLSQIEIKSFLLDTHRHDPKPINDLIRNTNNIDQWVIYDLPEISGWYSGSIALVGDSAHATSPHGAQGASLAIEDALILAKCIRDLNDKEIIFKTYQELRKERAERQAKQARNRGQQNLAKNPVSIFARDFFMPIAFKNGWVNEDWLYSYSIDWNSKIEINK